MNYELTSNTRQFGGTIFTQIRAAKDIGSFAKAGDLGGWIEKEYNLSQVGDAWVYGDAEVSGNAGVYGDAEVYGNAEVSGNARVFGNAQVFDNAQVYGKACVKRGQYTSTPTSISRSDSYTFTLQSDGSVVAGCRDFTPEQADAHWGEPSHYMHDESWAIIQALRSVSAARAKVMEGANKTH